MARTLAAGLITAQAARSPKVSITATLSARGPTPDAPALVWSELYDNGASNDQPVSGVAFSDGSIYRFIVSAADLYGLSVTDPTDPADWQAGLTLIHSGTVTAHAVTASDGDSCRLYLIDAGNVKRYRSDDSGATWNLYAGNHYSGGDAYADIAVARPPATHALAGNWYHIFSTYNAGTFAAYVGIGVTNYKYADDWRAAGLYFDPNDSTYAYLVCFRAPDMGPARLRVVRFDGAGNYDNAVDIDQTQAGLFGLNLACYRLCTQYPALDHQPLLVTENAYMGQNYEGHAEIFPVDGTIQAAEPIMFPQLDAVNNASYSDIVKAYNDRYYYFGRKFCYEGVEQEASSSTIYPTTYTYDENHIELVCPTSTPTAYVGQLLTLRRTITWNTDTGYEDLVFYITAVRKGKRHTIIEGVDAVGYLGLSRCRRPSVLNDGTASGLTLVMQRLAARVGLELSSDHASIDSLDVMPMTLQPSESLLGAAYRVTNQDNAWLVPDNTPTFALTLITGTSTSGDYDDTAHTYPDGQWTLIDAEHISSRNNLSFAYVLGTYSTDPEDGAYVAMAEGPSLPNVRPYPYSVTNKNYNTDDRVLAAAQTEADRQQYLPVTAVITAPANLSLELHDVIEVTDTDIGWSSQQFRVRRIREAYDRGRLIQTLFCGDL